MSEDLVRRVSAEDFPHGIRCGNCHEEIIEGQRYSERLEGFVGDIPQVLLVCVPCGVSAKEEETP